MEDIKIFVYDSRAPDHASVITPNPDIQRWESDWSSPWLAYFVDADYFDAQRTPPTIPAYGDILVLELETGESDFRREDAAHGGSRFDVILRTRKPAEHYIVNAYGGGAEEELLSESTEFVAIDVGHLGPDVISDLESVEIVTDFAGGPASDNWDLRALGVRAQSGTQDCVLLRTENTTPFWFTPQYPSNRYFMAPGPTDCKDRTSPR